MRLSEKNFSSGQNHTPRKFSESSSDLTTNLLFFQNIPPPDSPELGGRRPNPIHKSPRILKLEEAGPEGENGASGEEEDEDLTGKLLFLEFPDGEKNLLDFENNYIESPSPTKKDIDALFNYAVPHNHTSGLISEFAKSRKSKMFGNEGRSGYHQRSKNDYRSLFENVREPEDEDDSFREEDFDKLNFDDEIEY